MSVSLKVFDLTRIAWPLAILLAMCVTIPARGGTTGADDLLSLSIEDLMQIEVTSVSKRAQKLSETPAAVTVLTSEDIRRSGMTTIPDLLRMVPGLHVASISSNTWAVTARGGRWVREVSAPMENPSWRWGAATPWNRQIKHSC